MDRPAGTPGPITTTVTTSTNHGLTSGDRVAIDFSGSLMRDGTYVVTVTGDTTFTVAITYNWSCIWNMYYFYRR
jgi:hypothetical protein